MQRFEEAFNETVLEDEERAQESAWTSIKTIMEFHWLRVPTFVLFCLGKLLTLLQLELQQGYSN